MPNLKRSVAAALAAATALSLTGAQAPMTTVGRQPDGSVLTPIGQRLDPVGTRIEFDGRPTSLALSPDGATLAVANITSLDLIERTTNHRITYAYPGANGHTGSAAAARGLIFSPDGRTLYASTQRDAVQRFDVASRRWRSPLIFKGGPQTVVSGETFSLGSLPQGLALSDDGRTLYVALNAENRVVAVDAGTGRALASAVTGIAPNALARSGRTLAVLNLGGRMPQSGDVERASGQTGQMVPIDARTGMPAGGTVTLLDTAGLRVRATVRVGRHPAAALFLDPHTLLVAESNDDALAIVDVDSGKVVGRLKTRLPADAGWGTEPQALAASADGKDLFVALAGANAVAVYSLATPHQPAFVGALPTDWYPAALASLPDGGLAIGNLKGLGSLGLVSNDAPAPDDMPKCDRKASNVPPPKSGHDVHMYRGSVGLLTPSDVSAAGPQSTARAVALAQGGATTDLQGALGPMNTSHVFIIVKENRTYDQVLGDLPQGHGDRRFTNFPRAFTPNAHALAEQFVLLDNFYSAGIQSGDGHQWIVEGATSDYIEHSFPLWARSYPKSGDDPLAYTGSGFIWQNALRHGLSVRDYGEFAVTSFEPANATWNDLWAARGGRSKARAIAHSEIPDLDAHLDPRFAGYNLKVPDQARADEFLREFAQFERTRTLPNLVLMEIGNDHTAGFDHAFPRPCSMIADNDLALGRIVDAISHSPDWRSSLILVMEDDSQDGLDHIDGHRQVAFAIGPWVKRHAVVSAMYSQLSFIHTAEALLGLPPMNRFDAAAPLVREVFAAAPDATPYRSLSESIALDDMNPPVTALTGKRRALAEASAGWPIVDVADAAPPGAMNEVIWFSTQR